MNIIEIETFLMIVKTGSISASAREMFATQSTLSYRIKLLEEELEFKLLVRSKGNRNVELTNKGKDFLAIANQWMSLWKDTKNIKNKSDIYSITIGGVDSINNHSFVPHYLNLIDHKRINLDIKTYHSNEIYSLLENYNVDIGYVFSKSPNKNILTKHLYSEKMYLICHSESSYYDKIKLSELKRTDEVFLSWGPDYNHWHDQFWNSHENLYISINTGSMLANYLENNKNSWAIAPYSVIKSLQNSGNFTYYETSPNPPKHSCYELMHRYPKGSQLDAIKLFTSLLDSYLNTCDWIERNFS
jgi:DNA-binding transcriptional LysR family regulator